MTSLLVLSADRPADCSHLSTSLYASFRSMIFVSRDLEDT